MSNERNPGRAKCATRCGRWAAKDKNLCESCENQLSPTERDQTMSKKSKKVNASGADKAPKFPAELTAVAEGSAPLTVTEVIDRLYEVAAGDTSPATYGFQAVEDAERVLDKSMGPEGKTALARAQATRADRPPSSPRRVAALPEEARAGVPDGPTTQEAALDPAGPDLDFEESSASEAPPVTVEEPAAARAPLSEPETFLAGHLLALLNEGTVPLKALRKQLVKDGYLVRSGQGVDSVLTVTEAGQALVARLPAAPVTEPGDAGEEHDAEDHGGTPQVDVQKPEPSGEDVQDPGEDAPAAEGETREQYTVRLREMNHAALEAEYGKASPAKDSLLRCWIIVKKYGTGKSTVARPAAASRPLRHDVDPRRAAVAKFAAAARAAKAAFEAFNFDSLGAKFLPTAASPDGASVSGTAHGVLDVLMECSSCFEAVVAPAATPTPVSASNPPTTERKTVKKGDAADIAAKFAPKYADALSAEDMTGLVVTDVAKGYAACKTRSGEPVRLPYAHLVPAA